MKAIGVALAVALLGSSSVAYAQDTAKQHATGAHAHGVQTPFGIAGDARAAKRTVEIRMLDEMRFAPQTIDVRKGETIRIVLINTGKLPHELVIGTKKDLDRHAAMMMDSGMAHDEPHAAQVAPGSTGEIVWNFNRAGRFDYACLVAGHYQAGMTGKISVVSR
jgi:uncharacterized cupredoxin-like copper-binding protein